MKAGTRPLTALGLMSGTSMDGIDAAILTTDGHTISDRGAFACTSYPPAFRDRLRSVLGREADAETDAVARELTLLHAEAVHRLLQSAGMSPQQIDVVGFHGHTVLHDPDRRLTLQIGNGQLLAAETGLVVVDDFRSADVAAGGHGAPLASLYHAALARDLELPLAVLNIGGVANVTWIGDPPDGTASDDLRLLAFDTGPGNALLDDWVRTAAGRDWDVNGQLARTGRVDEDRVAAWLSEPYFAVPPPKSLDRNTFAHVMDAVAGLSPEYGAATLTAFTAASVAAARRWMPQPPERWLVTGGGRHNATMMAMLGHALETPVAPVEAAGWDGDAIEAQAFAFLAVRSLTGRPLSVPGTTGVPAPISGGTIYRPAA